MLVLAAGPWIDTRYTKVMSMFANAKTDLTAL